MFKYLVFEQIKTNCWYLKNMSHSFNFFLFWRSFLPFMYWRKLFIYILFQCFNESVWMIFTFSVGIFNVGMANCKTLTDQPLRKSFTPSKVVLITFELSLFLRLSVSRKERPVSMGLFQLPAADGMTPDLHREPVDTPSEPWRFNNLSHPRSNTSLKVWRRQVTVCTVNSFQRKTSLHINNSKV